MLSLSLRLAVVSAPEWATMRATLARTDRALFEEG